AAPRPDRAAVSFRRSAKGIAMRYHVIYRAAEEEETTHVEAQDAAAAVAAVSELNERGRTAFELLSVVPEEDASDRE
ncbi:MAG: hypothetical protein ACRDJW_20935, partial [Thermomicrobiales bacterium]